MSVSVSENMPLERGHRDPVQETFSLPQVDRLLWRR
jgi:hypothetical protein